MAGNSIAAGLRIRESHASDQTIRFISEPIIRVREFVHDTLMDFQIEGDFYVIRGEERIVMENRNSSHRWRIRLQNGKKAKFRHSILRMECATQKDAEKQCEALGGQANGIRWIRKGSRIFVKENLVFDGTRYWIIEGDWASENEALDKAKIYCCEDDVRVISRRIEPASGNLELFNIEYDRFTEINSQLKIVPADPESMVTVIRQSRSDRNGEELHDHVDFTGTLTVSVEDDGRLMLASSLPLERYLKRLISVSKADRIPEEYVKASAIIKRGELLHLIADSAGEKNYDAIWEFCDDFLAGPSGIPGSGSPAAIDKTKGQVLFHRKTLCNSVSTPICGGRTVNGPQIPGMKEPSYLVGLADSDKSTVQGYTRNLSADANIIKWLHGDPDVHCNPRNIGAIPERMKSLPRYFRWEISYTRVALEELVIEKLGESIGIIYDLLTVSRKPSGYIETLEILGSRRNVILHGEEQIRRILDKEMLPSSCFEVRSDVGEDGVPLEFIFHGAGWGNGIGMCHAGALAMALDGMKHKDILNRYYRNVEVVKVF